jgi:DNA-binding NarL/FixJ family response regulator
MIRLLVADDSDAFRSALVTFLKKQPSIKLLGESRNLLETCRLARKLMPDVVLLDLHLSGSEECKPSVVKSRLLICTEHVLAMSVWNDDESKELAASFGATALLDKAHLVDELMPVLETLTLTAAHRTPVPPESPIAPS